MDLIQRISECKDEDVNGIIEEAINNITKNPSDIKNFGFGAYNKKNCVISGFIPLDCRIKYDNMSIIDYSMNTTDFLYEYAHFMKKFNVQSKVGVVNSLETFIISYFGYPGRISRDYIFETMAYNNTTTDDEFFNAIEKNKIGDLKGKGAAECSEWSTLAQQVLSLFGIESYCCIGCIDKETLQEEHCFNIVKRKNDYALLDYSVPARVYNKDGKVKMYLPFIGSLSNEEFDDFIKNGVIKEFDDYSISSDKEQVFSGIKRQYVVGKFKIEKKSGYGSM